jgi:hypothetical protein
MQENSIPMDPSLAETKRFQDERDAELEEYFADLEKSKAPVTLRESEPVIAELEGMITSFEVNHSLTELRAIIELSPNLVIAFKYADDLADPRRIEKDIKTYEKYNPGYVETYKANIAKAKEIILRFKLEDARKFKIRMDAKRDMIPITEKLNNLKGNTNYERLKAERLILSRAIGTLQGDKINHK